MSERMITHYVGDDCQPPHVGPEVPVLNDEKFMADVRAGIEAEKRGDCVPCAELKRKVP